METYEELVAVAKVIDRLAERFPNVPLQDIEEVVWAEHEALDGCSVRLYIAVLVEHAAKARIRVRQGAAPSF